MDETKLFTIFKLYEPRSASDGSDPLTASVVRELEERMENGRAPEDFANRALFELRLMAKGDLRRSEGFSDEELLDDGANALIISLHDALKQATKLTTYDIETIGHAWGLKPRRIHYLLDPDEDVESPLTNFFRPIDGMAPSSGLKTPPTRTGTPSSRFTPSPLGGHISEVSNCSLGCGINGCEERLMMLKSDYDAEVATLRGNWKSVTTFYRQQQQDMEFVYGEAAALTFQRGRSEGVDEGFYNGQWYAMQNLLDIYKHPVEFAASIMRRSMMEDLEKYMDRVACDKYFNTIAALAKEFGKPTIQLQAHRKFICLSSKVQDFFRLEDLNKHATSKGTHHDFGLKFVSHFVEHSFHWDDGVFPR